MARLYVSKNVWFWKYHIQAKLLPRSDTLVVVLCSVLEGIVSGKVLRRSTRHRLVFHGPNGYISPNHYLTKQKTGRAVLTWNYVAAHVKGSMTCIHYYSFHPISTITQ
ncbi:FMN-binding negative transcriptional regulator [Moritella sp.]|nr:FMN-binding negative transcriptional regulator [Moritella sp.]